MTRVTLSHRGNHFRYQSLVRHPKYMAARQSRGQEWSSAFGGNRNRFKPRMHCVFGTCLSASARRREAAAMSCTGTPHSSVTPHLAPRRRTSGPSTRLPVGHTTGVRIRAPVCIPFFPSLSCTPRRLVCRSPFPCSWSFVRLERYRRTAAHGTLRGCALGGGTAGVAPTLPWRLMAPPLWCPPPPCT